MKSPPLVHFSPTTVYRIIPSRYPPVHLYREVAPADDWELLQQTSMRTNNRLVEETYPGGLIRSEDRISKSSSHYIIGPLSRPNPQGSRFADDTFGVLYSGLDFETTQAEVIVQREAFLRATVQKPQRIDMRVVNIDLEGDLHDLRDADPSTLKDLAQTRALGRKLRGEGSYGVVFESLLRPGGNCIAVFRPPVLSNCRQERHLGYVWDGERIADIFEYTRKDSGIQRGASTGPAG